MSTITLPNIRVSSDLTVSVRLKDNGVAIDWSTLNNVKASIYSDAQRALAGRCDVSVDAEDPTVLVCQYAANKPQYVGVCRIVVSAKYMGETKTYDKPAFNFVRWTADQDGEQITIDDPDVDVEIEVSDVSSSLLDEAIRAAFTAAEEAVDAKGQVLETEAEVEAAEALRVSAEESRVEAEEGRAEAEAARVDEEAVRVSAEDARVVAENARAAAEDLREGAEDDRAAAETARETAEAARVAAEALRVTAEGSRETAEAAREAQASADHTVAAGDHTQAAADHTQAAADHTTAASDHTQAGADHTLAAADHVTAGEDHAQAQDDHEVMAGYDTRLGNVEGEVSQLEAEVTDLLNVRLDTCILLDGNINSDGSIGTTAGRKHTAMLPIIDGFAYEVWGATPNLVHLYSAPHFNAASHLGTCGIYAAPSVTGAKYCSFEFYDSANTGGYGNLEILPNRWLADMLFGTPFSLKNNAAFNNIATVASVTVRKNNLALYVNSIKAFYLSGSAVDLTADYRVMIRKTSATNLDVYVYNSSNTTLINKSITIPSSGVVDAEYSANNYTFRIIADLKKIANASVTTNIMYLMLSPVAFSPLIGNPVTMQSEIDGNKADIASLQADMNDASKIYIKQDEYEDIDASSYYEAGNGAESGYVLSTTGATGGNSAMTRTTYIPLDNAQSVKTKTPFGSQAGLAFYDADKVFISGKDNDHGANGVAFIAIPTGAKYLRTTVSNTDLSGGTSVFIIKKQVVRTLQDVLQDVGGITQRNTNVVCGMESFVTGTKSGANWNPTNTAINSRVNLSLDTEDTTARQIFSKFPMYYSRANFGVSIVVNDADSFFGIGTFADAIGLVNELRIHNDNGSALMEIWSGAEGGDTFGPLTPKVVLSKVCDFALVAGNTYHLSIRSYENQTVDNTEHQDGVLYSIKSIADNVTEEIFVPRNQTVNNGIRNGITAYGKGRRFVSLKDGDIDVENVFISSDYTPHAKALIIGDSYVDGDTLIGQGGQQYKFACLLQSAIGMNDFVIAGKGGAAENVSTNEYAVKEIADFAPQYVIIELGANNSDFDSYETAMEQLVAVVIKNGLVPILLTVPPVNNGGRPTFLAAANAWIRSSGYRYVDLNKAVTSDNDGLVWKTGYVMSDGTHPTVLGHQAIYDAFVRELPELFNV